MSGLVIDNERYVLVVHCRNPYLNSAGSENLILSHIRRFNHDGIATVVIFPIRIKQLKISAWGCCIGGKYRGSFSCEKIIDVIGKLNEKNTCSGVFVHSLLFMDLSELSRIISFRKNICLYLHDFCSCCLQYNLRKNMKSFCGDALLYEEKCSDCDYYQNSVVYRKKVDAFFDTIEELTVIAPSEFVKDLWIEAFHRYKDRVIVLNHKKLVGKYTGNTELIGKKDKIKVAFVGQPTDTKGYDKWLLVTEQIQKKVPESYLFYHFGNSPFQKDYIKLVPVSIVKDGPNAMINALRDNLIDVAVLFSSAPETYSYTFFESMASNCFVITNNKSGNIAVEVRNYNNGIVIENSSDELYKVLLEKDNLKQEINRYKSEGLLGPERLQDNEDYATLLHSESVNLYDYKGKKCNSIKAMFINLLYRVRFKI